MNAKLLKLLRIGALLLGCLLVIGILADLLGTLTYFRSSQRVSMGFSGILPRSYVVNGLSLFFSRLGSALFAFLIAAVIRMIEKQAPVGSEIATRVMIVCCISYTAEAVARFCLLIPILSEIWPALRNLGWRYWLTFGPTAAAVLVPLLYAASIFVLYTHFTRMVTFESEVA